MILSSKKLLEKYRDPLDQPKIRVVEKYAILDHEEAGLFDSLAEAKWWFKLNVRGEK